LSSLQRLSLSKAGAKLRTFSLSPTFTHTFFQNFCKKIHKSLVFRYILRHILWEKEKKVGRGTQYIITRVQLRARLGRTKKPRKGEKISGRTENSFRKKRIFLPESPEKSTKMMKTGRKISFPAREKT